MTIDEAKEEVKRRVSCRDFLEPSKGRYYCCPFCRSGHKGHVDKDTGRTVYDGALQVKPNNYFVCRSCGEHGDVIELYQKVNNLDFQAAVADLARQIGIEVDPGTATPPGKRRKKSDPQPEQPARQAREAMPEKPPEQLRADYAAYCERCRASLLDDEGGREAREYLEKRGIDPMDAHVLGIGYDAAADPATAPGLMDDSEKRHPAKRLIIPTGFKPYTHYLGRSIDPVTPDKYRVLNALHGDAGIFNVTALYDGHDEVFVCEGVFDALSVFSAGRKAAIALNSVSNYGLLLELLEKRKTTSRLIICLDNDEPGREGTRKLSEGLRRLRQPHTVANIAGDATDPNDALQKNRPKFCRDVLKACADISLERPDSTQAYIETRLATDTENFADGISTGFHSLDSKIKGLRTGLYVLAAMPSLGKTTFLLQVADQIAAAGHDVIFYTLEQSRFELVSKSVARYTARADIKKAVHYLEIMDGCRSDPVEAAVRSYLKDVEDRLSIVEGNMNASVAEIRNYVAQYIRRTNTQPVVIVDYLQILRPPDKIQGIREAVDANMSDLKRASRDLNVPIILISSINRSSYTDAVRFESLKESGGIESTADVVLGFQLEAARTSTKKEEQRRNAIDAAKAAEVRKIEITIPKNRFGSINQSCHFDYYPEHDLFQERDPADQRASRY